MEDDLLLESQIKKKKRVVLLMLLSLLLVTAAAAALLEPTSSDLAEVAVVSPAPSPTRLAYSPTGTPTSSAKGDEWPQPSPASSGENDTTRQAATPTPTATIQKTVQATRLVNIPIATVTVNNEGAEASVGSTPSRNEDTTPTVSITSPTVTAIAEIVPTTDPGVKVTTPAIRITAEAEGTGSSSNINKTTPVSTEISKRVHESWDVLDGSENNEAHISTPTAPSPIFTTTATVSETMMVAPPNGLPITGIITQQRMNWMALTVVILLIGAGVVTLLYPKLDRG